MNLSIIEIMALEAQLIQAEATGSSGVILSPYILAKVVADLKTAAGITERLVRVGEEAEDDNDDQA